MTIPEIPNTFGNLPDQKKERVLHEATLEFAEHGYHQASINRIVSRLGIAKGSLFRYFGTKEGLFEYLFSSAINHFKKPLKVIRDRPHGDFFDQIEKSLLAGAAFVDEHPHIYRIYLKMLFQENFPFRNKFLSEIRQASTKYLQTLILTAIENGQLRSDLDTNMAVSYLEAVMDRFLQAHAVPSLEGDTPLTQKMELEAKARALTDFLKHGLSKQSA